MAAEGLVSEVVFISGVADKLAYASRLLRKKHRADERVAVFGPIPLLAQLDQLLWTEVERDFFPHLRLRPGEPITPAQQQLTRIWLLEVPDARLQCNSAVNLGMADIAPLLLFERIAELVSRDAADEQAGRQRWRQYLAGGCTIQHHPQAA